MRSMPTFHQSDTAEPHTDKNAFRYLWFWLSSRLDIAASLRYYVCIAMSIPEATSTEGLERFLGGKCLFHSRGEAWRDLKAWIVTQPAEGDTSTLPSVSEAFLAWTISGEVDFHEREYKRPWITHRIRKGSFFLTTGGAPYDVRWKAVTSEPFQAMFVFVELPVLQRAMGEVYRHDLSARQSGRCRTASEVAYWNRIECRPDRESTPTAPFGD